MSKPKARPRTPPPKWIQDMTPEQKSILGRVQEIFLEAHRRMMEARRKEAADGSSRKSA